MVGLAPLAILLLAQTAQAPPARDLPPTTPPPPVTEIYLASIQPSTDGNVRIGSPENISNNPGYDNQPFFLPDGQSLLFTSMRDGKQTDIYQYAIGTHALTALTATRESEYSPKPIGDGRFSVIRVEADGSQRLWAFPLKGGAPALLLPEVKPVGYHAWADANTLVLFVLGDPPTLRIADVKTGKAETIGERPGRCLAKAPDGKISFVQKGPRKEPWQIMELDVATRKATSVTETLEGREDYAWLPDGRLLMASGSSVFIWGKDNRVKVWQEIADLSSAGLANITRIAVSADGKRIALVAEAPK